MPLGISDPQLQLRRLTLPTKVQEVWVFPYPGMFGGRNIRPFRISMHILDGWMDTLVYYSSLHQQAVIWVHKKMDRLKQWNDIIIRAGSSRAYSVVTFAQTKTSGGHLVLWGYIQTLFVYVQRSTKIWMWGDRSSERVQIPFIKLWVQRWTSLSIFLMKGEIIVVTNVIIRRELWTELLQSLWNKNSICCFDFAGEYVNEVNGNWGSIIRIILGGCTTSRS